jgi:predicted transcriptional regulator
MSKAVIGIETEVETRQRLMALACRADQGETLPEADYHLNFADAVHLFSELTPQRLRILETLKQSRTQSIDALAKYLGRHYSTVYHDVQRLIQLDLIAKDEKGQLYVPWEAIEIRVTLAAQQSAA